MSTAPTVSDFQQSVWSDATAGSEVTPTLTWASGDFIVVLGVTEDNSGALLNLPTATGLTFAAVAGSPTNTASNAKIYAWTATAGSGGSSAVTATRGDFNTNMRGIAAFAFTGSDGLGNTSIAAGLGTTTTQSLIRGSDNSAVIQAWGDWNAVNDVTVTSIPSSGATQRIAQWVSGRGTAFVLSWTDQGVADTTSYGFSGFAGGKMSAITLEILGTAGGGGSANNYYYMANQ